MSCCARRRARDGKLPTHDEWGLAILYSHAPPSECAGAPLCSDCATQAAESEPPRPVDCCIYLEGPVIYCSSCGAAIDSTHGATDLDEEGVFFFFQDSLFSR